MAGIGTFIETFIRNAPDDLEIHLLGVTSQPERFAIGQWHSLSVGRKQFRFFPLVAANPVHVTRIPLSLKILWSLFRHRKMFVFKHAIVELHRIEPMLAFLRYRNPKILFLHGHNMQDFYNKKTEVRWGKFPWLYFWLEKHLLPRCRRIFIVREDAARDYQKQYATKAHDISFLPTWVDEAVFQSLDPGERRALRNNLIEGQGLSASSKVFLFVGRFEGQKDPLRLLRAFKHVRSRHIDACLILIGEGGLKTKMQDYVSKNTLAGEVRFLPPMSQQDVGQWMNAADALCLSSAFEGMPRAAVEALYCGLPVISTAVGEARRLIGDANNVGRLVTDEGAEAFANAMIDLLGDPPSREACAKQVEDYTARKILTPVYDYYRELLRAVA